MKQGITVQELVQTAAQMDASKRDFKADTHNLQMEPIVTYDDEGLPFLEPKNFELVVANNDEDKLGSFSVQDHCAGQIADKMGVPRKYFWRMWNEAPSLLAHNINHWFQENDGLNLVRTLDGKARAFLSSRYRVVDHLPILSAVLPVLGDRDDLVIESCQITESRLYLKFTLESLTAEIPKVNEIVQFGGTVRNSEIGLGGYDLSPWGKVLSCLNGMGFDKSIGGGRHIGRNTTSGDDGGFEVDYQDDTLAADQKAVELKMRDALATITKPEYFQKYVERSGRAVDREVHTNPTDTVEILSKDFGYSEDVKDTIIGHLMRGGQFNQWGVAQAVTRTAGDVESYDEASKMENQGGFILSMNDAAWGKILSAQAIR